MQIKLQAGKRYKTRSGKVVDIFEVKENGATANCHGWLHRITKTRRVKYIWNIWCDDGRFKFVGESSLDIVEELTT